MYKYLQIIPRVHSVVPAGFWNYCLEMVRRVLAWPLIYSYRMGRKCFRINLCYSLLRVEYARLVARGFASSIYSRKEAIRISKILSFVSTLWSLSLIGELFSIEAKDSWTDSSDFMMRDLIPPLQSTWKLVRNGGGWATSHVLSTFLFSPSTFDVLKFPQETHVFFFGCHLFLVSCTFQSELTTCGDYALISS